MIKILGIDPANKQTGYVIVDNNFKIYDKGIIKNDKFIELMRTADYDRIALEVIVPYGQRVGKTTFATAEMIGAISMVAKLLDKPLFRATRPDITRHLGVQRSTKNNKQPTADSQIITILGKRFAKDYHNNRGEGTKDNPDYFYGFKADIWQAFAVAVYYIDTKVNNKQIKLEV